MKRRGPQPGRGRHPGRPKPIQGQQRPATPRPNDAPRSPNPPPPPRPDDASRSQNPPPRRDTPRRDTPRADSPRRDSPRRDAPRRDAPRSDGPRRDVFDGDREPGYERTPGSRAKPVQQGDEISVEVESLADGPDALCRVGDYIVFVAGALPGEKVFVRVTNAGRKFGRAELLRIERASPDRVGPKCPHFLECGGCHFQHLAYPKQLEHKTARLAKALSHSLRRTSLPILPMAAPESSWGQRNKIALQIVGRAGEADPGFFRMRSRDVVPIKECPVQDPAGTELAFKAVQVVNRVGLEPWREYDDRGVIKSIVVRAMGTGQSHVTVVSRETHLPREERLVRELGRTGATTVSINVNDRPGPQLMGRDTYVLAGPPRIVEEIGGLKYLSSAGAFFQTSSWGAAFLADAVRRLVDAPEGARVIDLYSGGGLLSLALADAGAEVVGIEENPSAASDARASARANGLEERAIFATGQAESLVRDLQRERRPYAVVLDPPRDGCDARVIDAVARLAPERIVYISCEPMSLARDLAHFDSVGFETVRVEPLDMFPHAFHVEAVVVLEPRRRAPAPPTTRSRSRR